MQSTPHFDQMTYQTISEIADSEDDDDEFYDLHEVTDDRNFHSKFISRSDRRTSVTNGHANHSTPMDGRVQVITNTNMQGDYDRGRTLKRKSKPVFRGEYRYDTSSRNSVDSPIRQVAMRLFSPMRKNYCPPRHLSPRNLSLLRSHYQMNSKG